MNHKAHHSHEYRIKILTPIWTGNVDGQADRIHEPGIIGGLRWWYEVMIRGLGGDACDPSQEKKCAFSEDEYHKAGKAHKSETECLRAAGLCDVCRIFGATGWRRRFRLTVYGQTHPTWKSEKSINIKPFGRTRGWFLNAGVVGTIRLLFQGDIQTLEHIYIIMKFMEKWGGLGARPQLGYGAFCIEKIKNESGGDLSPSPQIETYRKHPISQRHDLRSCGFFRMRFVASHSGWWRNVPGLRELRDNPGALGQIESLHDQGLIPVTPALKNHLRFERKWSSSAIPHWLFGTLKGDTRIRGKVAFSWAYRRNAIDEWEIRGWMGLPQDRIGRSCREEIWRIFQDALGNPASWMRMLGMKSGDYRSASLDFFPAANPWRLHSAQDIEISLHQLLLENSL